MSEDLVIRLEPNDLPALEYALADWLGAVDTEDLEDVDRAEDLIDRVAGVLYRVTELRNEVPTPIAVEAQAVCSNPWHTSAPARMAMLCPECPSQVLYEALRAATSDDRGGPRRVSSGGLKR